MAHVEHDAAVTSPHETPEELTQREATRDERAGWDLGEEGNGTRCLDSSDLPRDFVGHVRVEDRGRKVRKVIGPERPDPDVFAAPDGAELARDRVLKLEPRGEAALDLQAIDAGKLLHDILRRFFERHRREPLHQLDRKKLQKELANIADAVFDEHERVVPPLNRQIWKIDREIRKILLDQVLLYELDVQETAEGQQVLPSYFEVAFGGMKSAAKDPDSKEEPLELTRQTFVGEETIKISGQIDRVDVAKDNTLIAYDYKLSTGSSRSDIISGRSLQLPIYLEALERLILPDQPIAGGGYYIIRGAQDRRNKGLYRASQLDYLQLRAKNSVFSDEEWQKIRAQVVAKIWDFLDGMRAGQFVVDPSERKKTCRFCDFAAVCRYDRYRIEGKKRGQGNG